METARRDPELLRILYTSGNLRERRHGQRRFDGRVHGRRRGEPRAGIHSRIRWLGWQHADPFHWSRRLAGAVMIACALVAAGALVWRLFSAW